MRGFTVSPGQSVLLMGFAGHPARRGIVTRVYANGDITARYNFSAGMVLEQRVPSAWYHPEDGTQPQFPDQVTCEDCRVEFTSCGNTVCFDCGNARLRNMIGPWPEGTLGDLHRRGLIPQIGYTPTDHAPRVYLKPVPSRTT